MHIIRRTNSRQRKDRRRDIREHAHPFLHLTSTITVRKTDHKRHQHSTLINRPFFSGQRTAIIRVPDDNRILPLSSGFQFIHQRLELTVHLIDITIHHRHIPTNNRIVREIGRYLNLIRRDHKRLVRPRPHPAFMSHLQVKYGKERHSFWRMFPMRITP